MGLTREEHLLAVEHAIVELAEVAGLPLDSDRYPGVSSLRLLAAERLAYRAAERQEQEEKARQEFEQMNRLPPDLAHLTLQRRNQYGQLIDAQGRTYVPGWG